MSQFDFNPLLTGVTRQEFVFSFLTLGEDAAFNNTVTDPMECRTFTPLDDGLKEGIILSMLRISFDDSGVCLGRDQALVIQTASGGEDSCSLCGSHGNWRGGHSLGRHCS